LLIKFVPRLLPCIAFLNLCCLLSAAQQTLPPANSEPSTQAPAQTNSQKKMPESDSPSQGQSKPTAVVPGSTTPQGKVAGTSNDRLFYTLPNFLSLENAGQVAPLTAKQKFSVVARSSFDYVQYPWYGFLAGISQAENSEPGFGQGSAGYGKRFASAFADGTIENFMVGAALPSLLHQDPRFFQSSDGSFTHRAGYAVSRILSRAQTRAIRNSTIPRSWAAPCRPQSLPIPIIPGVRSSPQSLDPDFTGQIEP
jgi:hypothetical protein